MIENQQPYGADDIDTFCLNHKISRAFLYKLWQQGKGPAKIKLGRRTLITRAAASEWILSLEHNGGES